jgi:hypothetical protein
MKKKSTLLQWSEKASRDFFLYATARDLPGMARFIYQMALENDTKFFKQLGKALSGRKYTHLGADKREAFILEYYLKKPNGTNADCMSKLVDAGFPRIGEANFRMLKRRLLAKVKIIRSKDELPEEGEWFGILLDRNKF